MSYKYNPYRDTFTHIDDEEPITARGTGTAPNGGTRTIPIMPATLVYSRAVDLTDECIERIAEAVVRKMGEEKRDE